MKVITLSILIFLTSFQSFSHTILKDTVNAKSPETVTNWTKENNVSLLVTQNAFVNWDAGGNNSVAGIIKLHMKYNYKNEHTSWTNELSANYGLSKEQDDDVEKTDDKLEINSTFGYKSNAASKWNTSAKFSFSTQFANGYTDDEVISRFFAPAYLYLGVGSEYYSENKQLKLYVSPITNKTTLVFDSNLANEGSFGVNAAVYDDDGNIIEKGEKTNVEFGTLLTGEWKTNVMENIKMENKLTLYSDYIHDYGNVDVNWELNFDLTINKYVTANVGTYIKFDDDVLYKEDTDGDGTSETFGPRIQLKQLLGVGFSYKF